MARRLVSLFLCTFAAICGASFYQRDSSNQNNAQSSTCLIAEPYLNGDFAQYIVDLHNQYRANESPATAMFKMTWNDTMARYAQAWANQLLATNASKPTKGNRVCNGKEYGQSIFFVPNYNIDIVEAIERWYAEKKFYYFDNDKCLSGKSCGHYKRLVWGSSYLVGCGITTHDSNNVYVVCNYYPRANVTSGPPYTKGTATLDSCNESVVNSLDPGYAVRLNSDNMCEVYSA